MKKFIQNHPILCAVAFITLCLLPALTSRDFTYMNELRYLEITDEALSKGEIFALTNNGLPYADKPPLYFWLMMLCKTIAGEHSILLLSLLAFIPAMVTIFIMDRWLLAAAKESGKIIRPLTRIATALILASTGIYLGTGVFIRMDQMMVMFIVLSLFAFYRMFTGTGHTKLQSWLFPVWIFMALFTKGPVGLLAPLVSVLCFLIVTRNCKQIGRYLGFKTFGVILALSAIWFGGVLIESGPDYLYDLTIHQTFGRAVNAFHHKMPFYFYLYAIIPITLPYVFFTLPAAIGGFFKKKDEPQRTVTETFFLCITASTFVMLSLFSSKLPIYLLPIIPFIVYLGPIVIMRKGLKKWMRNCVVGTLLLLIAISGAGAYAVKHIDSLTFLHEILLQYPFIAYNMTFYACLILLAGNILALATIVTGKSYSRALTYMACGVLMCVYAFTFQMNSINPYIGYGELCSKVPEGTTVNTLYLNRPENMSVYLGREIVDYKKDTRSFLDEMQKDSADSNNVLLVNTVRYLSDTQLSDYVKSHGKSVTISGPYSIILF